jgi:hypothetical protein
MPAYDLDTLVTLLSQTLTATIAVISGSFFLYSLTRDIGSRVARAFSALLLFVTITYIGDLGVSYSGTLAGAERWLRFQWIGIAFVPAAYFHLSDALLATTGLVSRGRRRRAVRYLYVCAALFLMLVAWTDLLVRDPIAEPAPHFQPGPLFWVFVAYFGSSVIASMTFVIRARRRCLTQTTHRRMTYLLVPYFAPALAVFPFLLVSAPAALKQPTVFWVIVSATDVILALLLVLMAYPLAFFESLLPDRLIKAQMLQFVLRGPTVALAALGAIIWAPRAGAALGLSESVATASLTVGIILLLQWAITLARPVLEALLIYTGDQAEARRIRELEERLLTGADFRQLLESILATACDFLRVHTAFVASLTDEGPRLEKAIGLRDDQSNLDDLPSLSRAELDDRGSGEHLFRWNGFWILPLHSGGNDDAESGLVGVMGIEVRDHPPFNEEEWAALHTLTRRAAEVLEDRRLQGEVFAALEGLLPEMAAIQRLRSLISYGGLEAFSVAENVIGNPNFPQLVKDALAHYWGGPKLTDSQLMGLTVVQRALEAHNGNPQNAMRAVLQQAIEQLRPAGERNLTTAEWILYNILEMRFIQGRKVRDVALRLAMSESDLYRKQRVAIETLAGAIAEMERSAVQDRSGDTPDAPAQIIADTPA